MKCSVVILNWNGVDMLRRYLPSVVHHTLTPDNKEQIEVVVADNGSTDDSLTLLSEQFPDVRLIPLDRNYGFAEGYNRAISLIDSDYTVLLNSDVEVTPGWLTPLLQYMDQHPQTAACQPKILSWISHEAGDQPVRFEHAGAAGGLIDLLGYPYCRGRRMSEVETDHGQYDTIAPVFWTSGAAMCIRTRVYKDLGGLDPDFFAHMEEIDLCWRMQCQGYQLVCVPQSAVYHLGGGALNYGNPRKTYLNFRNNLLMLYKNLPYGRLWWVLSCRFFLDYAAAAAFLLKGQTADMKAVFKARYDFLKMIPAFRAKRHTLRQNARVSYPDTISKKFILLSR